MVHPTAMDGLPPVQHVDVDGDIAYREWRTAGSVPHPAVVCVHGLGETHLSWMAVAPALARHRRVVALDLPGYGLSPRRGRPATLDGLRGALAGFVDRVSPDEPVVLIGNSMGGGVAALHAASTPARTRGLVLSSGYLPPVFGGWRAPLVITKLLGERVAEVVRMTRRGGPFVPGTAWFTEAGLRAAAAHRDALDPQFLAAHRELQGSRPGDHLDPLTFAESFVSLVAASARVGRTRREYRAIECPVLVVHGRVDHEVPIGWARAIHAERPEWSYVELEDTGHVAQLEDPGRWVEAVEPWLARLDRCDDGGS